MFKLLMYSTRDYDKNSFRPLASEHPNIHIDYTENMLTPLSACQAQGYDGICVFVNDQVTAEVIEKLASYGVKLIALRCAGYNNVDLDALRKTNMTAVRVPKYSPESVAEHAMGLTLMVNRHLHKSYIRCRENNFNLSGLAGLCLNKKTAGIVGYGKIGRCYANICRGMGMKVIAFDPYYKPAEGEPVEMVSLEELYKRADLISLHAICNEETKHMINRSSIAQMKDGVILVNVSRGELIDNEALIEGIEANKFWGVALDVYEGEGGNAFTNHENAILKDSPVGRLLSYPNVVITSHQAFLTYTALEEIAKTTLTNIDLFVNAKEEVQTDLKECMI